MDQDFISGTLKFLQPRMNKSRVCESKEEDAAQDCDHKVEVQRSSPGAGRLVEDSEDPGRCPWAFLDVVHHVVDQGPVERESLGVGQVFDAPEVVLPEDLVGLELPTLASISWRRVDRHADYFSALHSSILKRVLQNFS